MLQRRVIGQLRGILSGFGIPPIFKDQASIECYRDRNSNARNLGACILGAGHIQSMILASSSFWPHCYKALKVFKLYCEPFLLHHCITRLYRVYIK